jgi:hypothetical protein
METTIAIIPHKTSAVLSLAGTFKTTRTKKHPVDRIRDFIPYDTDFSHLGIVSVTPGILHSS